MTTMTGLEFDTRGETSGEHLASAVHTHTSVGLAFFRHLVRSALASSGDSKAQLRRAIVERLLRAREPFACIDELLAICSSDGGTERLDTAVDILAATKQLVLRYTWNYLIRDVQQWSPYSSRAYQPNDDQWYILLRAVARCDDSEDDRLRVICACRHAAQRGIVEAVIEALGDLASPDAAKVLRDYADNHSDSFVRGLAKDVLADLE